MKLVSRYCLAAAATFVLVDSLSFPSTTVSSFSSAGQICYIIKVPRTTSQISAATTSNELPITTSSASDVSSNPSASDSTSLQATSSSESSSSGPAITTTFESTPSTSSTYSAITTSTDHSETITSEGTAQETVVSTPELTSTTILTTSFEPTSTTFDSTVTELSTTISESSTTSSASPSCTVIPATETEDIVVNGNFEDNIYGNSIAPPWVRNSYLVEYNHNLNIAQSGEFYLQFRVGGNFLAGIVYQDTIVADTTAEYTLEFYYRVRTFIPRPTGTPSEPNCKLTVTWGSQVLFTQVFDQTTAPGATYTQVSVPGLRADTVASRFTIQYACNNDYIGTGVTFMFIDTVSLKKVVPAYSVCE